MRSRVTLASLALPFQIRQCRRSTSATITALAFSRSGVSAGRVPAVFSACCSRMAMWNQSRPGGAVTPASTRIERSPEQPSVKAVNLGLGCPDRPRQGRAGSAPRSRCRSLATAAKTCRAPSDVSTLPRRTSRWRWPSSQLRMKVESRVRVIAAAAVADLAAAASRSSAPTFRVRPRKVSGPIPASIGRRYSSTPAATR